MKIFFDQLHCRKSTIFDDANAAMLGVQCILELFTFMQPQCHTSQTAVLHRRRKYL